MRLMCVCALPSLFPFRHLSPPIPFSSCLHPSKTNNTKSPLTPGTPAIDLLTHLHNQAERIVAERGIQITLPFRFKHPQPDDVIPYQVVEADGSAKELRDGEKIVLKRREEGSERVVKAKELRRL